MEQTNAGVNIDKIPILQRAAQFNAVEEMVVKLGCYLHLDFLASLPCCCAVASFHCVERLLTPRGGLLVPGRAGFGHQSQVSFGSQTWPLAGVVT